MSKKSVLRLQFIALSVAAISLATVSRVDAQTTFFSDNFNRASSTNLDDSTNGMSGLLITSGNLIPGSVWKVPVDLAKANGSNSMVAANELRMGGWGNSCYIFPNFNIANLVASGTVSVAVTFTNSGPGGTSTATDTYDRYDGVGVGFSVANGNAGAGTDRWMQNNADLFVDETKTGYILIYDGAAAGRSLGLNFNFAVPLNGSAGVYYPGTLRIDLTVTSTAQGSNVVYNVLWNGGSGFTNVVTGRSFAWSGNNAFYVGTEDRSTPAVTNTLFTVSATSYTPPAVNALTWRATANNNWDTSSIDWVDTAVGLSSYAFFNGSSDTFDDSAANTTVNIPGPVSPASVNVSCINSNYVFTGAGPITGTGSLLMSGTGTLTLSESNSFSGGAVLSAGRTLLANNYGLGSGTVTFGGGGFSSDSSTPRTINNPVTISSTTAFGDPIDNGLITLTNVVNLSGTPTLNVMSPTLFANGATNGDIGSKIGTSVLTINGICNYVGSQDVQNGTLIYNAATVTATDRIIADAGAVNGIGRLVFTNGSSISVSNTVGNLRSGRLASTGSNYVDVAGLYSLPNADLADGYITLQGNAAYSEMTFWPGGDFTARGVLVNGTLTGSVVFKFNGGFLRARNNNPTFMQGLSATYVEAGGANIDDGGSAITIAQPLQDGSVIGGGSGGLTKFGAGTVTLTGANTYTGPTVVNNGTLVISASSFTGGGAITVASNATLNAAYTGSSIVASSFNAGSSTTNYVTVNFGSTPVVAGPPVFQVTTLNGTGTVLINIAGTGFATGTYPLFTYGTISGASSFKLGPLPVGLSATLQPVANGINLVITAAPKNLEWAGIVTTNWDLVTKNWYDFNNSANQTNYAQPGGVGDLVTFDDSGSFSLVNLGISVTPSLVTFNNNNDNYTIAGSGSIGGAGGMVKTSASGGSVTIDTTNTFSGGTDLQAGNLLVGCNQALGVGTISIDGASEELACAGNTPITLSNNVVLTSATTAASLGDTVNTGPLTLAGTVDFSLASTRALTLNSDVILAGAITNTGNGGITTLGGPGRLIITGQGQINVQGSALTQTSPNVIISGGVLNDLDAWRLQGSAGVSILLAITNGGVLYITNSPGANLRVGLAGGDPTANNTLDVAGTVIVYGTGVNGSIYLGGSGAVDTFNLRAGAFVKCNSIQNTSTNGITISTANFYGGTLVAATNTATFMQTLSNAFIWNGLTVDTTNFNITIAQPLLAGGAGGLNKNGAGMLTLTGSNNYTGTTVVNGGKLVLTPAFGGTGGVTVNASATLAFQQSSTNTVDVASVNIGSGAGSALEADLSSTNSPAGMITNLTLSGNVLVNFTNLNNLTNYTTAVTVPLFGYGTISGSGSLTIGQLPSGISGTLTTNSIAKTINLVISTATPPTVPHITTVTYSGGFLGLAGTNGNPNGGYAVVTTTNLAVALTNWTVSATGTFGANGSFTNSLPVSTTEPKRFYSIKNPYP